MEVANGIVVAVGALEVNMASSLHVLDVVVEVSEVELLALSLQLVHVILGHDLSGSALMALGVGGDCLLGPLLRRLGNNLNLIEVHQTEVDHRVVSALKVGDGVVVAVSALEVDVAVRLHVLDLVVKIHESGMAVGKSVLHALGSTVSNAGNMRSWSSMTMDFSSHALSCIMRRLSDMSNWEMIVNWNVVDGLRMMRHLSVHTHFARLDI